MKKKLTGFALLSSLFLLTACNATNTGGSGSGDGTAKSEQVSGDSSETEEVSYDELYASVLDLYRPIAINGDTSAVPSNLSSDEAYATSTLFDAKRAGENVQYSYVDINDDGSDELLIGTPDSVHALYYLDNDDKPVFAKSAGTFAKGGYLSTMKFYKDGTIYCQQFQRMRPEAKAETYEIKDGVFNQLQSVDFSMSETTDGASKVGLGNEQTLDLSSEDWYDFDDSSSDDTEESSSDSKSNKETGMDINAIQNGYFSSLEGTWENGRGDTIVFSKDRVTQSGTTITLKFGEVKERILKEYSWAGESVGSSQLFMISSGVSILDNNESDNNKDRLLGTQSDLELGQSSDFHYRKIRQSGWDLYSQWLCSP